MPNTPPKLLLGLLIPNIFSLVMVGGSRYLSSMTLNETTAYAGVFIFSNFIIVPLVMGIISARYWRDLAMKNWSYVGWSAVNALIAIAVAAVFFKEGAICLIIISPLIFVIIVAGAFIGKAMLRRKNNTLNVSFLGILLVIFIGDLFSKHEYTNAVSDTIIVNAPIEKVWPLVVEYEPIKRKENYWLFRIGMPSPVQSTVDGHQTGAGRKCIFSNGYIFEEKMVVYKPNDELTFDILTQPRDPEIMGHIDIIRGQFKLIDNGNGTTTLVGTSWYKLYIFPVWYFDAWSESITRNVHLRVMDHIKILSEKDV